MWLRKNIYVLLLFLFSVVLLVTNTTPGAYLTGWDNFHIEFDPLLHLYREFFGVWRENRSFGLVSGMAHMADFPRVVIYLLLSVVLPEWFLRTVFMVGTVFGGTWGMYVLLQFLGFSGKKRAIAFAGAVFYMLNLGTVQNFILPLESFSVFFAGLPWLTWIFLRSVTEQPLTTKTLLLLCMVNILFIPAFLVQTMFLVYMLVLGIFACGNCIQSVQTHSLGRTVKRQILVFSIIIALNAFWLLPQVYFVSTNKATVDEAKINQISTENVSHINKGEGTLTNFIEMKGLVYELQNREQTYFFQPWFDHIDESFVGLFVLYIIISITLVGLLGWKRPYYGYYLALYLITAIALMGNTFPFSALNDLLLQSPFISQVFRSPFTKFIVVYSFVASYFFAQGLLTVYRFIRSLRIREVEKHQKRFAYAGLTVVMGLLIYYSWPSFQGYYFSPDMRKAIPNEYFYMFDYFKTVDKNKRLTIMPDATFWGWYYHTWGYNGSGFMWYGVEQPIVSRTFDVWNEKSEGYFWELKSAMQLNKPYLLEQVMRKYAIDYMIYDKSIRPLNGSDSTIQHARVEHLVSQSDMFTKVKEWGSLQIFEVDREIPTQNFVSLATDVPEIGPEIKLTDLDGAYLLNGTYTTSVDAQESRPVRYYPFLDLMSQTRLADKHWQIRETDNNFILEVDIPDHISTYDLQFLNAEKQRRAFDTQSIQNIEGNTRYRVENGTLWVTFPKVPLVNFDTRDTTVDACGTDKTAYQSQQTATGLSVSSSDNTTACFGYGWSLLDEQYGYLMRAEHKNWQGQPLSFYILDSTNEAAYIEDRLRASPDFFILSPDFTVAPDFSINFQNKSYGSVPAQNELGALTVFLFPIETLKSVYFEDPTQVVTEADFTSAFTAEKQRLYRYRVSLTPSPEEQTLILNQAYDPGWKAYSVPNFQLQITNWFAERFPFLFGEEVEEHGVVNNWANGWKLTPPESPPSQGGELKGGYIALIFWPQYLQFLGFFLLTFPFIGVVVWNIRSQKGIKRTFTPLKNILFP
jgi:hypothetical protein